MLIRQSVVVLVFLFCGLPAQAETLHKPVNDSVEYPLQNRLADSMSPYLQLHATDPVAWQEWNEDLLDRARQENKLILLSIGYFSCHWCHVMQRESFKDKTIAAYMNQHFIPVKIDRELEEAIDARMIDFAEKTLGRSGWPLNVFITPEGFPLYALLYLPPGDFHDVLKKLNDLWANDREGMLALARQGYDSEQEDQAVYDWSKPNAEVLVESFVSSALERADILHGGFGEESKFPSYPQLAALLDSLAMQTSPELEKFLNTTLEYMASQGLRDYVGGGFFRYTTDPDWQTPHFEKMLYDNAQLAMVYQDAAMRLSRDDYLDIARDTLRFMQREMLTKEGAMVTSLSAVDDKDVEGGYYLWTREQLKKHLGDGERKIFESMLVPTSASRFEAGHLPVWIKGYQASMQMSAQDKKMLQSARDKLLGARERNRVLPVDDKLVSGLNGLALSAFARMAKLDNVNEDNSMRETAEQLASYVRKRFWTGRELLQARRGEKTSRRATLADYAYVAEGMWHYYRLTGAAADRELARQLVDLAWQRFHSPAGWLLGGASVVESGGREGIIDDGPTASPSAVLLKVSYRLAKESGDSELEERVKKALGYDPLKLNSDPFWYATQVSTIRKVFVPEN